MRLKEALRIKAPICLALVGAGGKSTTMFTLARELESPVIVSASTHLSIEEISLADKHLLIRDVRQLDRLDSEISSGVTILTGEIRDDERTLGLSEETLFKVFQFAQKNRIHLILEADGSRRLPIKAPADHEPAVPAWVNGVMVSVGLSGLGKPIDEENVFRTEQFLKISESDFGDPLTIERLAKVLKHPLGGLKNIPVDAKRYLLLNQADTPIIQELAFALSKMLICDYDTVLVNSYHKKDFEQLGSVFSVHKKVAGVILAAGESSRYGTPKALLDWKGEPLIRHVVRTALESDLLPVKVVVGAVVEPIRNVLSDLPVEILINENWGIGQSTSVKMGVGSLQNKVGASILLMADQPQVPCGLLKGLIDAYTRSLAPMVVPKIQGHPSSPVLLSREVFGSLKQLKGDTGARALFSHFPVEYFEWDKPDDLFDIDTLEDYQRLLRLN